MLYCCLEDFGGVIISIQSSGYFLEIMKKCCVAVCLTSCNFDRHRSNLGIRHGDVHRILV